MAGLWHVGAAVAVEAKAQLGQWLLEEAWDRTLAGEDRVRPWPWADTWPVARLEVPGHGIDLIVLADASGRSLAWAPGHVSGTARPTAPGLTIFGGHRDTHFRFLAALLPGEPLSVQTPDGRTHTYQVTDTRIVDSRRAVVRRAAPGPALALVTCYPFDAVTVGGPLRYLVHAAPAGPAAAEL
ncbi:MAG: class GN sortase [Alphaproteobacteria bacterium]|jgi:sortase A|nr:class GN sortase [Alphaproteobacteria bacterium]